MNPDKDPSKPPEKEKESGNNQKKSTENSKEKKTSGETSKDATKKTDEKESADDFAPSQSTQSMEQDGDDMIYPPETIKTLNLKELMQDSQTNLISNDEKAAKRMEVNATTKKDKPVLDQQLFDKHYGYRRVDLTLGRKVHWHFKQVGKWKWSEWGQFAMGRIPISRWLPTYHWREYIVSDVIGGLMIAIICVPQGLAYGFLVGVPPIYGLFTGIFGPLVYCIFGTSKHTSPGSFAIVSLMIGSAVEQYSGDIDMDMMTMGMNNTNGTFDNRICCEVITKSISPSMAIGTACSITLLIGLFQIFFGILNAGLLAVWLSDHLVQGLTSGAAIHVFTSQLKSMTGVTGVPSTNEAFSLIKFYICFFNRIYTAKMTSCIVSAIAVSLLLFSNYFIDPILKKFTKLKFPMEFFLVFGSVLIVYLAEDTIYHIDIPIVGKVESGLVAPSAPPMHRAGEMIGSAITIAIVSFVIHIAMAKLVSKKLNYQIDANQEWLALGAMHAISSFFGSFAGGSSLGRTMMQVKLGTKTQLCTIVCCCVLVVFVYGAASYLYHLPKAVLASIVVVAMKDLFIQLFKGFRLYRESIVDFLIFLVTLMSVILINVNLGLVIGVAFALLSVVFRTQCTCMGRIPGTSDFKGLGHYRSAEEIPGIKVFRFDAPLYFANAELFLVRVHNACGLNPILVRAKLAENMDKEKKNKEKMLAELTDSRGRNKEETESLKPGSDMQLRVRGHHVSDAGIDTLEEGHEHLETTQLTHIVIDCSSIPYLDLMGKDALAQTYSDYRSIDITVMIAHCKVAVRQMFETTDFYTTVPKNRMFVNVNDAVTQALIEQREKYSDTPTLDTSTGAPPVRTAPVAHSPATRTLLLAAEEKDQLQATQSIVSLRSTQKEKDEKVKGKKDNKKDEGKGKKDKKDDEKLPTKPSTWRRTFAKSKEIDKTQ